MWLRVLFHEALGRRRAARARNAMSNQQGPARRFPSTALALNLAQTATAAMAAPAGQFLRLDETEERAGKSWVQCRRWLPWV